MIERNCQRVTAAFSQSQVELELENAPSFGSGRFLTRLNASGSAAHERTTLSLDGCTLIYS
jgi:hypothetical protein